MPLICQCCGPICAGCANEILPTKLAVDLTSMSWNCDSYIVGHPDSCHTDGTGRVYIADATYNTCRWSYRERLCHITHSIPSRNYFTEFFINIVPNPDSPTDTLRMTLGFEGSNQVGNFWHQRFIYRSTTWQPECKTNLEDGLLFTKIGEQTLDGDCTLTGVPDTIVVIAA